MSKIEATFINKINSNEIIKHDLYEFLINSKIKDRHTNALPYVIKYLIQYPNSKYIKLQTIEYCLKIKKYDIAKKIAEPLARTDPKRVLAVYKEHLTRVISSAIPIKIPLPALVENEVEIEIQKLQTTINILKSDPNY